MRLHGIALVALCSAMLASAASQVSAVSQDCSSCHPAEANSHARTRMAHAMLPVLDTAFAANLPDQPLRESQNGYQFLYRRTPFGVSVTAERGDDKAEGLIEWVMGAGAQGQTPLVRAKDNTRESRVSYFPQLHQYGITIGQEAGASSNAETALGAPQSPRALKECLSCHATAVTKDAEPASPGVQCERCHPGAAEHARGKGKPLNPGKLSASQQVHFCGACHRNKPPVDDQQLENIRFQPLRLMKSRCFIASGKLACTTCHPAHQDARRNDPAFYNARCHACHDAPGAKLAHVDGRQTGDCIACHMPSAQLHPALKFTDHYIRIVKSVP